MPLLIVLLAIVLLFGLIAWARLNAFLAFLMVSLFVGVTAGLEVLEVVASIEKGLGKTLGGLILILGLGAMLGKLVADSGAAQRITERLIALFGPARVQWAMVLTGFIIGIPLFYTVGFVIVIPIVFTVAATTRLPLVYVGLPMLAALSVTHGYLPPHPSPTGIAVIFSADIGLTLLYGIVVAIPAIIVAGPLFARTVRHIQAQPLDEFVNPKLLSESEMPSTAVSLFTALLPVGLIGGEAALSAVLPQGGEAQSVQSALAIIGNPNLAMLLSVLVAVYTLGLARGRSITQVMDSLGNGLTGITLVLFIIAGAGAFKEVLVDAGVSDYIGGLMADSSLSPLLLAWLIATVIRVCVGSATVAGLTAAGIVSPLLASGEVSPELMVLAIGSGSLMLSHVNDSGFWLYKEYFNLSVRDTLRTWTVMETLVGVMGLLGVLVLDWFV